MSPWESPDHESILDGATETCCCTKFIVHVESILGLLSTTKFRETWQTVT